MTPAQKLRAKRNELLGEPKLEFGTEVVKAGCLPEFVTGVIADDNGIRYTGEIKAVRTHATRDVWLTGEYKILGKPVTINDVLRMLKEKYKNKAGFFINQYGIIYTMAEELQTKNGVSPVLVDFYHLGFNLSLSTVEDEPDEVLEKLLALLGD